MRRLIYVPVIHMGADIGSLAEKAAERAVLSVGEEAWQRHMKTVAAFWLSIARYFDSFDARGAKVYQDGMFADGDLAKMIIEDGIKAGSSNFRIISSLLQRGATLVSTEDYTLLKEERDRLMELSKADTRFKRILSYLIYSIVKGKLLKRRDTFIAKRINATLKDGETGVLFIGANHNVETLLDKDIEIDELKDKKMLRQYQRGFIFRERRKEKIDKLAMYLASPVEP